MGWGSYIFHSTLLYSMWSCKIQQKGGVILINSKLEIIAINEPLFNGLTTNEKQNFIETLYSRILEFTKDNTTAKTKKGDE